MSPPINLFRFVSVRPGETVPADDEQLGFVRPPDQNEPNTDFQREVYDASTRSAALSARTSLSAPTGIYVGWTVPARSSDGWWRSWPSPHAAPSGSRSSSSGPGLPT